MIKYIQRKLNTRRAYQRLSDNPDFQLVLKHLCYETGITRPRLTSDSDELKVREGQQQLVHSILRECHQGEDFLLEQIEKINQKPEDQYETI